MADRTDIDALLIGSLYGELTPADEARLAAHLESHPADRTALADLAHTRDAVRGTRLAATAAEPPQAISALLLQEASRRAPARRDPESTSRLQHLLRSLMRSIVVHPAMAAAATLVLGVGVAGTLYLRDVSPPERSVATAAASESLASASPAATAQPPMVPGAPATGPAVGAGAYRVDLASPAEASAAPVPEAAGAAADVASARDSGRVAPSRAGAIDENDRAIAQRSEPAPAKPAPKQPRGIELRSAELAPKELGDSDADAAPEPRKAAGAERVARGRAADEPRNYNPYGPGAGGAPAAPPPAPAAAPPSAPAAAAPAPEPRPQATKAAKLGDARRQAPPAPASSAPADDKAAADPAVLGWARGQRTQVLELVAASKCSEAAAAAVEIYRRAPGFYAASVAADPAIRPCQPEVERARSLDDRSRARAATPTQAAPSSK